MQRVNRQVGKSLLQSLDNLDQIRRDTHSSHVTTGARTLHNKRVASVALSVEADDVVTALQPSNSTVLVKLLQSDADLLLANVHTTHIPHHLALLLRTLLDLRHLGIKLTQPLHERLGALRGRIQALQLLRDQRLNGERIGRLHLQPSNTRQDGQLPSNIHSVQIISRVGLGVSQFLRLGHNLTPLLTGSGSTNRRKSVEQERQSTREHTLNAGDLVAGGNQIPERGDDREPGTNGTLVVDEGVTLGSGGEDVLPEGEVGREALLVGGDDGDAGAEEDRVGGGEGGVTGVVDEDGAARSGGEIVGNFFGGESAGFGKGGGRAGGLPFCGGDAGSVGGGWGEEGLGGAGEEDELGGVGETGELVQEGSADATDAWCGLLV